MKLNRKVVWGALGFGAAVAIAGACSDEYPSISATAPTKEFFTATLTGTAERPTPVTTTASGSSEITILNADLVRVETLVSDIDAVTQAHIHAGTADVAGPVMVFLFGPANPPTRADLSGVLTVRDIDRLSAFSGSFTFDSLVTRIRAGTAYVNVHTTANAGGEIRGQIVPK